MLSLRDMLYELLGNEYTCERDSEANIMSWYDFENNLIAQNKNETDALESAYEYFLKNHAKTDENVVEVAYLRFFVWGNEQHMTMSLISVDGEILGSASTSVHSFEDGDLYQVYHHLFLRKEEYFEIKIKKVFPFIVYEDGTVKSEKQFLYSNSSIMNRNMSMSVVLSMFADHQKLDDSFLAQHVFDPNRDYVMSSPEKIASRSWDTNVSSMVEYLIVQNLIASGLAYKDLKIRTV